MWQILISCLILLFSFAASAEELSGVTLPNSICAASQLKDVDIREQLNNLQKSNPGLYHRLLDQDRKLNSFNARQGSRRQFWAVEISGGEIKPEDFYTLDATLKMEQNSIRIWVEDDSWDQGYVTAAEVDAIFRALTISTASGSIDPSLGIVEIDTTLFGLPPDKAGDGFINFLVLDIRDSYDPQSGNNNFVAGYFFPYDQSDENMSNRMDLLYIDSTPGIYANGARRTTTVLATTAHELQHLIHHNYDTNEETWVNEGLSELSSTYCGYGLDNPGLFLNDPNRTLTGWSNQIEDYSRVGLWTLYAAEQFGFQFIKNLIQNQNNGINGFNAALSVSGYASANFEITFRDWTIANYVNDVNVDGRYGYQFPEAAALRAAISEDVFSFPQLIEANLQRQGAQYYRFNGSDTLEIEFFSASRSGMLMRRTADETFLIPLDANPFLYPAFNQDDEFVLILNNTGAGVSYDYCAYAPFSTLIDEIEYDDGGFNLSLTADGIAANKFVVEHDNMMLEKIKYFNVQDNSPVTIHVYGDANGSPGAELIAPVDTLIPNEFAWVELILPETVDNLQTGQTIYVGIGGDTLAYDSDRSGSGISYFRDNIHNWQPLSNFQAGNQTLTGVWMIRAIFRGGLTASGPRGCKTTQVSSFQIIKIFPNPARGSVNFETAISGSGELTLTLYNVLGQKVTEQKQFFSGSSKSSFVPWRNIRTFTGQPLPSGVYFIQSSFKNFDTGKTETGEGEKFVLIR